MNQLQYATFTDKELEKVFTTNISNGLTTKDVTNRLKHYGQNNLTVIATYWWTLFIKQFNSPFLYLLFFAALVSFATANGTNGLLILVIIMVNTLLSFVQEYRAEKAARLLKQHLIINTRVKRNGEMQIIDSKDVVPGDIIVVQAGDYIPADLRFIETHDLTVDESLLTGESVPVTKTSQLLPKAIRAIYQALNMGFLGTHIVSGSAVGIAIATGAKTQFGAISHLTLSFGKEQLSNKNKAVKQNAVCGYYCNPDAPLYY